MTGEYRRDIDGLRAVAVLSVMGFHAFPAYVPGGFVGVDIFFVISGYLISQITLQQAKADRFSFFDFYVRRVKRIFPALILILIFCVVSGWFFLLPFDYRVVGKEFAASAVFLTNIVLWQERGYFDTAAELKPLLH